MDSKTVNIFNILKTAVTLFREQGYEQTSIRQIASAADVSLGMVNHYFGNKEFLGTQCLILLSDYASRHLEERLDPYEEPVLFELVSIRVLYSYLNGRGYGQFYIDSLKNDFFFKYLSNNPVRLIHRLSAKYPIQVTDDEALLYTRYLPYMMEKTLVLKKTDGIFQSIDWDRIPLMIALTAMNHLLPETEITSQDADSIRIAEEHVDALETEIPDPFLMDFVEKYIRRLETANAERKNNWLREMNRE